MRYSNIVALHDKQHRHAVDAGHRAAELEPVRLRHLLVGDGDEAGEPRFGREQVVVRGVEPSGRAVVAPAGSRWRTACGRRRRGSRSPCPAPWLRSARPVRERAPGAIGRQLRAPRRPDPATARACRVTACAHFGARRCAAGRGAAWAPRHLQQLLGVLQRPPRGSRVRFRASGRSAISSSPCASAISTPARLPLSTVDT